MPAYWGADDLTRYADTAGKPGRLQEILRNLRTIVDWNLEGDEESALVVADSETSPLITHAMAGVLRMEGIEPTISVMSQTDAPNHEPTDEVRAAAMTTDAVVNMCTYTITHTAAIEEARAEGATYLNLPDPTEDSLIRGAVEADPEATNRFTHEVAEILRDGDRVTVTSPAGTDVEMRLGDRETKAITYPKGETPTCPIEETVNGTIVHDSFMMGVGLLDEPIVWEVTDGWIETIEGGREARALEEFVAEFGDDDARWIAEFSVMTNPKARPNGNYIEHKQVSGGVHFAMGNGTALGGEHDSSIHLDGVQLDPTVTVDGDVLVENGEFAIDGPA